MNNLMDDQPKVFTGQSEKVAQQERIIDVLKAKIEKQTIIIKYYEEVCEEHDINVAASAATLLKALKDSI